MHDANNTEAMAVATLHGPLLDHWVARALGAADAHLDWIFYKNSPFGHVVVGKDDWNPCRDWGIVGHLVDWARIQVVPHQTDDGWHAVIVADDDFNSAYQFGRTACEAVCRTLVAARFGETVDIGEELVYVGDDPEAPFEDEGYDEENEGE